MNPYLVQVPIYVSLPVLLQAQANYLALLQNMQQTNNLLESSSGSSSSSSSSSSMINALKELEKSGASAYSVISKPSIQLAEKNLSEPIKSQTVVNNNIRKGKKVPKPWHLPSHKLFRNAIYKQILQTLHDPEFAVVFNRLTSVGCDVKKFAFALESKLYYSAERLEEYLEFTTLKKRIGEEIKKTKKVFI
jgi:hypothetical protein